MNYDYRQVMIFICRYLLTKEQKQELINFCNNYPVINPNKMISDIQNFSEGELK
jgi:hypothetical protein